MVDGLNKDIPKMFKGKLEKRCRVKAETFVDAYGFCLSTLIQDFETYKYVKTH